MNEASVAWATRNSAYMAAASLRDLHPMPVLSRLWGYDEEWYRAQLHKKIIQFTLFAGRRMTPPEFSLFSLHASRGIVAASYDRPVALAATAFFVMRGAATFRMPFYQPRFTRFSHPHATRFPFLASTAWHCVRAGAYGVVGCAAYICFASGYREYMEMSAVAGAFKTELGLQALRDDMKSVYTRALPRLRQK